MVRAPAELAELGQIVADGMARLDLANACTPETIENHYETWWTMSDGRTWFLKLSLRKGDHA
jgi:hypothetical protein